MTRMMSVGALVLPIACVSLACAAGGADAAITYTSQPAFVANLTPGYYGETYASQSTGGHGTPWNFAGGAGNAWSYAATTSAQAFLVFDLSGDRYLTTSGEFGTGWARPITLTFTGAPVYAVGGSFFYTTAGGAISGGTVALGLSDGGSALLTGQSNSTFWGYISTTPITSLTFTNDATNHFASIDNLIVGTSPLPAPATVMLLGVAGCFGTRRRRG